MAEGTGLENRHTGNGIESSNLSLSVPLAALLAALLCACGSPRTPPPAESSAAGTSTKATIEERGREVLVALKNRDGARLATLVHPRGVRFSAYAYVHLDSDVVIPRAEVPALFASDSLRRWGTADGSGAPITLSFRDYYGRFVYDADFLNAPKVARDAAPLHSGNTPRNFDSAYPGARFIEYHFPGFDPKYEGMDWKSLYLVFEQSGPDLLLVGVVHASWTI